MSFGKFYLIRRWYPCRKCRSLVTCVITLLRCLLICTTTQSISCDICFRGNQSGHCENVFPFQADCRWGTQTPFRHCLFFCYHMVSIEVGRKAISHHVYVSVFAFIFQVKGQRCHICPSYEAKRLGSSTSSQLSDIFLRHVDMNISTSAMLPSQRTTLGKQRAGWQGKPPCDQMFRKENLWCCGSIPSRQDLKITTVVAEP